MISTDLETAQIFMDQRLYLCMEKALQFLKKLKSNNDRDWFEANKQKYLDAKDEYAAVIGRLISGVRKFDKKIAADLDPAKCMFRIYRDVRFSKDKKPYKTNMGASIDPGGKKSLVAGYYLHLEPGNSFLAGGVYMPDPAMLQRIRQEIDYNSGPLLKIMRASSFKKYFKGLDEEDKLKTVPKGYDKDHPQIELLKNKHFLVSHQLSDRVLLSKDAEKIILEGFKAMFPFLEYLRHAQAE
jgi:uncharacterized protein (TIGR02453 family)